MGLEPSGGGNRTTLNTFLQRQLLRKKYGIPLNALVLLSVGEVNRNKNHRVAIEALSRIDDENIYYIICGQGPLIDELRSLAQTLGVGDRVILAGYCENIVPIYGIADVFVLPSLREGLPVALMEAMASGLPCIGSDIRGIRDLLPPELMCVPTASEGLAHLIKRLIADDSKRLQAGRDNRKKTENYTRGIVGAKMREIYDDAWM